MNRFVMPTASLKPIVGKECCGLPITVTATKCRQSASIIFARANSEN